MTKTVNLTSGWASGAIKTVTDWIQSDNNWGSIPVKIVDLTKGWTGSVSDWIQEVKNRWGDSVSKSVSLAKGWTATVADWIQTSPRWGDDPTKNVIANLSTWKDSLSSKSVDFTANFNKKDVTSIQDGSVNMKAYFNNKDVTSIKDGSVNMQAYFNKKDVSSIQNDSVNMKAYFNSKDVSSIQNGSVNMQAYFNKKDATSIQNDSVNMKAYFNSKDVTSIKDGSVNMQAYFNKKDVSSIQNSSVNMTGNITKFSGLNKVDVTANITGYSGRSGSFASGGVIADSGRMTWWDSVKKYASGTSRAMGSLFVAGEAGPEVVGHVNGRTEVLNKSQIASAIYSAVLTGMGAAVNSLGAYIAQHMASCTNAVISAIIATKEAPVVTLSQSDTALLQRLAVLSGSISYAVPAYATGTVMPYEIVAEIRRQTHELKEAIYDSGEQVIQAIVSAISSHGLALADAIGKIQTSPQTYSPEWITQRTIDEINLRTQMTGRSPLY